MKESLAELAQTLAVFAKAMLPGALGAAVAVSVQQGLTIAQRALQLVVGIIVSYYAGEAASELLGAVGVIKNAVGFTAGVAAFETVKALRVSFAEVARRAPSQLWEWLMNWFPKRK